MNLNFANLYWYVAHYAKKLGIWGLLGLLLIIGSSIFYVSKIPPLHESTEALILAHQVAQSQDNDATTQQEAPLVQNTAEEIAKFYERFPEAERLPEVLATINQLANQQKIVLNSGDYKLNKIKQSNATNHKTLTKYEITFPVKGPYTQIRTFVADVLEKLPAIALTDIQMNRESTMDSSVESKLVFTLFVKGEAW
ncbi:MAG: type 4a pilus biogenesis protein PilO [Methylophilus sp.]